VEEALEILLSSAHHRAKGLAYALVLDEVNCEPVPRFPLGKILGWLERFSERGWHGDLDTIVGRMDIRGLPIPASQAIRWGMRSIASRTDQKPGSCLLLRPDCITHPSLNLRRIGLDAESAVERQDHASTRLFILLMANAKLRGGAGKWHARQALVCMLYCAGLHPDRFLWGAFLEMLQDARSEYYLHKTVRRQIVRAAEVSIRRDERRTRRAVLARRAKYRVYIARL
jgi:hypothetical protein